MSIPKEPRQLMINLMYLVLTALLALNVSAEVMNAFFSLDRGMKSSGEIVDKTNELTMTNITKQAEAYKNPNNQKYKENADKALTISKEFISYIDGVRDDIWKLGKGDNPKVPGQPLDIRNKDVTTKYFCNEKKGDEIQAKIEATRIALLALADNDPTVASGLPLAVEEVPTTGTKMKTWTDFKFKQMPIAAIFPILGKMQSDAKNSSSAVLNYCLKKVAGEDIKMDAFEPVVSAKKAYIIRGETYEADVFLSAYSTTANNISISAGGQGLSVKDGKGKYTSRGESVGTKKFPVSIRVTNPLTKEVKTYNKEFEYEVGEANCSVQLDKMNVFYIGVDNPITVAAGGVSSNELKVNASGVNLTPGGAKGAYVVRASTPGEATITISGGVLKPTPFKYKVKRIPDPTPLLGAKHKSASMGNGEFKAQGGVAAVLENFDFDAKCDVVGFKVGYLAKRQDPIEKVNSGARYNPDVSDIVNRAKPGDVYFFDEIKAKCPGDVAGRQLGSLVFKIR